MLHAQNHNWVWRSSILPCCDQIRDFISNLENSLDLSLIFPVFFILHHLKNTAADRLMGSLLNMGNPRLITTSALFVQIRNFREITSLNNFLGRKYFSSSFFQNLLTWWCNWFSIVFFLVCQKDSHTRKNLHWAALSWKYVNDDKRAIIVLRKILIYDLSNVRPLGSRKST